MSAAIPRAELSGRQGAASSFPRRANHGKKIYQAAARTPNGQSVDLVHFQQKCEADLRSEMWLKQ
jgi:hypothetical protein